MPKRNYGYEKRQKELEKKRKKEEKRQRKLDRNGPAAEEGTGEETMEGTSPGESAPRE